jgi:NTE family protein
MEKADVLLVAELADFGSSDYSKAEDIIQKGYEAAASKASVLSALSVDEATWEQYLEQREQKRRTTPVPQFVEVTGTSLQVADEIKDELSGDIGKPVDTGQMSKSLTALAGGGRFARLDYGLVERNGQTGLLIEAQEKSYSPPSVRPVIIIDGSDYLNVRFKIGARITFLDFGKYGAELRNDVIAGSEYGISTEYYRPFGDNTKWFVAPKGFANTSEFDIYDDNSLVAEYRNRLLGGALDVGYAINRQSEARFGYEIADQNLNPQVGNRNVLPNVDGRVGITSFRYSYIGTDNPVVPRSGWNIFFKSAWQDANPAAPTGFPFTQADISVFKPITKPASLFFEARGGTTFGHDDTGIPPFSLGGPTNLSAYGTNELLNNQFFLFRTGYIREVAELPPLLGDHIYLIGTYEIGKAYGVPNTTAFQTDVSAGFVINTIFGPISFGGAIGDSGHHKFFFGMGRVF